MFTIENMNGTSSRVILHNTPSQLTDVTNTVRPTTPLDVLKLRMKSRKQQRKMN